MAHTLEKQIPPTNKELRYQLSSWALFGDETRQLDEMDWLQQLHERIQHALHVYARKVNPKEIR